MCLTCDEILNKIIKYKTNAIVELQDMIILYGNPNKDKFGRYQGCSCKECGETHYLPLINVKE